MVFFVFLVFFYLQISNSSLWSPRSLLLPAFPDRRPVVPHRSFLLIGECLPDNLAGDKGLTLAVTELELLDDLEENVMRQVTEAGAAGA